MGRVLPILFNTEMVQAILDGRKNVTRRAVKYRYSNTEMKIRADKYGNRLIEIQKDIEGETHGKNPDGGTWHKLLPYIEKNPPYKKGDILYVREAYCPNYFSRSIAGCRGDGLRGNRNAYKADYHKEIIGDTVPEPKWRPSIHMPKQAARIWLRVTDVRVERLQDITQEGILADGVINQQSNPSMGKRWVNMQKLEFEKIWNATIKKTDLDTYGWNANPWVWVIGFERCNKPESEG